MNPISSNVVAYPTLSELRLADGDLECLRRQGFVASEMHRGQVLYKLRFRRAGSQRVRVIGTDKHRADLVKQELAVLQHGLRARRDLRRIAAAGRQLLRRAQEELAPLVPAGYYLHGRQIRKCHRRRPKSRTHLVP